jgi:3-oxoacyl-[acyl-carrier protein] reductase
MNKNVLLIGASGGLGKHFTLGLAKAGYNMALHYFSHPQNINELESGLHDLNIKFKPYNADISNENEVSNLIRNVNSDFGSIDVLINNAGISIDGVTWKLDIDSWNKVMNVNLTGPFLCSKHVLPLMKAQNWGRIINISSVVPQIGIPGTVAYSVSKSGLTGLTKTIAKEVVKNNITANQISLGYFNAGMLYRIKEEIRNQIKESIPKKEFGNPDEIINCILFLLSDNASYITGQNININGGLY